MIKTPVKRNIIGVEFSDVDHQQVLEYMSSVLSQKDKKVFVVTPNPEMVVYSHKHPEFKKILNEADLAVCDGMGTMVAGYILNRPLPARIPGVDLMVQLCSMAQDQGLSIGLLGGRGGVAERTAQCLRDAYPDLTISFIGEEWPSAAAGRIMNNDGGIMNEDKKRNTKKQFINHPSSIINQVDILFVAFGFPKQEEWISDNLSKIPVRVAMGVGGAFDYISGSVTRAPLPLRFLGFEWLYRLYKEPWRWRRQIALIEFIWLLLKTRLGIS